MEWNFWNRIPDLEFHNPISERLFQKSYLVNMVLSAFSMFFLNECLVFYNKVFCINLNDAYANKNGENYERMHIGKLCTIKRRRNGDKDEQHIEHEPKEAQPHVEDEA